MKKDYSELLRRLECGPVDGMTREAAYRAISELVAERDASTAYDAQADMKSAYNEWAADAAKDSRPLSYPVPAPNQHKPKPAGSVTLAELDAMSMRPEPPAK